MFSSFPGFSPTIVLNVRTERSPDYFTMMTLLTRLREKISYEILYCTCYTLKLNGR